MPRSARVFGLFAALAALVLGASSCGDDRSATDSKTLYGCSAKADCLSGYDCICGWCQAPGSAIGCDASTLDSGGQDAGGAKDAGGTVDAGTKDAGAVDAGSKDAGGAADTSLPAICNVLTWAPCPTGYGCYYDGKAKTGYCDKHGAKAEGQACSNAAGPECGKSAGVPMLCDAVDSKCYKLCDTSKGGPCPSGQQCYALTEADKTAWPDNAGICAP